MDPLSITATVLSITAQCLNTAKILNDLRARFQNARVLIAALCSEVTVIGASLSHIQNLILQSPGTEGMINGNFRPELETIFDSSFTGCRVVIAALEEEVSRLAIGASSSGIVNWRIRARYLWKEAEMKELLSQLRGQQIALGILVQAIQLESQRDANVLLLKNSTVLQNLAHRTQTLRNAYPEMRVPTSIFHGDEDVASMISGPASTASATAFDFDDLVFNSRVYKKAFSSSFLRKPFVGDIAEDEQDETETLREAHDPKIRTSEQGEVAQQSIPECTACAEAAMKKSSLELRDPQERELERSTGDDNSISTTIIDQPVSYADYYRLSTDHATIRSKYNNVKRQYFDKVERITELERQYSEKVDRITELESKIKYHTCP